MGKRGLDLGTGFPLRGFSQTITVLDEEIDEGGWEPSLNNKGSAAFGGLVEVGNQPGETSYFGFLPWKRHVLWVIELFVWLKGKRGLN